MQPILTALSHLLVLSVFRGYQLCHLLRDHNEADPPGAPQIFILALLEGRSDAGFFPGLRKTMRRWRVCSQSHLQLPQHSWGHPSGPGCFSMSTWFGAP